MRNNMDSVLARSLTCHSFNRVDYDFDYEAMPKICSDLYTIEMSLFVAVDRTTQHQLQRASLL